MKSNGDVIMFVETKMECEIETLNEVKKKKCGKQNSDSATPYNPITVEMCKQLSV